MPYGVMAMLGEDVFLQNTVGVDRTEQLEVEQ